MITSSSDQTLEYVNCRLYFFVRAFSMFWGGGACKRRGLSLRGLIIRTEKALYKNYSSHSNHDQNTLFIYWFSIKLQNFINRIHSSTCGGSLYPGGVHDHNRMYFFNTGKWIHYWGRGELIRGSLRS